MNNAFNTVANRKPAPIKLPSHNQLRRVVAKRKGSVNVDDLSGDEARVERIRIKKTNTVEIRVSWWKNGHLMNRPLDLPEAELMTLIAGGFATAC
jgi:hypothetical protein